MNYIMCLLTKLGKHAPFISSLPSVLFMTNSCFGLDRQKRMMGMTPNEAELVDVDSHHHTDRIPMEMKEKSVAENLLDKMSETQ